MANNKSHPSGDNKQSNAWMVTTIIFAVLFFLMLAWNGVLTAMVLLGGGAGTTTTGTVVDQPTAAAPDDTAPTQPTQPTAPTPTAVSEDDDPVLGDPDAPVTIIEFSDYECPFCGRFYRDSMTQIKADYVENGDVKIVFRDFPLSFHARAVPAAVAAECVQELSDDDTYFEYHDLLFENQDSLDDDSLLMFAEDVGIDGDDWSTCYADEDGSIAAEVNADFRDGQAAGVSGTPTIFINGQKIVGAQPYTVFQAAIDAELA